MVERLTKAEVVAAVRASTTASRSALAAKDIDSARLAGREAFKIARSNRSHKLLSEAWITLIEALAPSPSADDYGDHVEGAFEWAETMPQEIQLWLLPALEPHLRNLGLDRLADRAQKGRDRAEKWLSLGNMNVLPRIQSFHLDDLARGRHIDPRALGLERQGAAFADELWDLEGDILLMAADAWDAANRSDRGDFLRELVTEMRAR